MTADIRDGTPPPAPPWVLAPVDPAAGRPDGLSITVVDRGRFTDLRIDPHGPGATAVAELLGAAPPTGPNTWTATADGRIVWLGPDEWLVAGSPAETELRAVLGPHGAATDVSGQWTALRIRGPLTRELLALGCALDTHPAVLGPGRSAQTTIARVPVLLVVLGPGDDLLVHVRPSFAGHLTAWLHDATHEFRTDLRSAP
ncbi:sarcosine oxidase subunit gamma family protein [Pseudonocardia sp. NPDC049635]|uniref:sarcosine oxidase subunit gamma n=1 Tax=Pseudonocardia sp. NPDC049635 TaxID=3155506 RepID=UPI0033DEB01B